LLTSRTFKRTPKHDWASHAADAFRYLSLAWREPYLGGETAEDREAKREIERYARIHGPQPMAEKLPDGTIRIYQ
jgi:hypothetical protein